MKTELMMKFIVALLKQESAPTDIHATRRAKVTEGQRRAKLAAQNNRKHLEVEP